MNKDIPRAVELIAIIYYICASLFILAGLGFIALRTLLEFSIKTGPFEGINSMTLMGIASMVLGIFIILLGIGLHKGKYWAYITNIILMILTLIALISFLFIGKQPLFGGDLDTKNFYQIIVNILLIVIGLRAIFSLFDKEFIRYFR